MSQNGRQFKIVFSLPILVLPILHHCFFLYSGIPRFCNIAPEWCINQKHIENPVKHLRQSILRKQLTAKSLSLTIFVKRSILDLRQGSQYADVNGASQ